jgi:hypothetical protein
LEVSSVTLLSRADILRLATDGNPPHVSLYMRTHRAGRDAAQDPIRFKNLVARAEAELTQAGHPSRTIAETLGPARGLLEDPFFWQHASDGLAVLLSGGAMDLFRLPIPFEQLIVVGEQSHLKPLLPALAGDGAFFVLALSQGSVRLFSGSREGIREVDLEDIPTTLRDAVGYDYEQRSLQFHTGAGAGKGGVRRAMFHGHGEGADEDKTEVIDFFQQVDAGIRSLIGEAGAPVVLAGVGWETALYRGLTRVRGVLPEGIDGSPDRLTPDEIHGRAWALVEPLFEAAQREAADRYLELADTPRASDRLEVVLPAATEGRVETLFVPVGRQAWGRWNPDVLDLEVHEERRPGDRDLLDALALTALANGAVVYAVEAGAVPGGGQVAAVLRF